MFSRTVAGTTGKIIEFPVFDSSSAVGALLTGLVYNSGSLSAYYDRWGAAGAGTAISLITMTKGTWVSGGFIAVDATNLPGVYQLCLPDAAIAAGASGVTIYLKGATNMVPVAITIELTSVADYPSNVLQINGTAQTGRDIGASVIAASVTAGVTVSTNNDKSGYSLSSAGIQAIWDALTSALTTAGSIGKRIVDYLTGDSYTRIGAAGAGLTALGDTRIGNLDATVSSRSTFNKSSDTVTVGVNNDKSGYSLSATPPTAIQIRTEMDSNSTKLSNLDATISSRSTLTAQQVWEYATRTLSSFGTLISDIWTNTTRTLSSFGFTVAATVADKTGYSLTVTPPTAIQIRQEIDSNSTKLDASISTRLAASSYTAPDNSDIISIKSVTDKLNTAMVLDGSVYDFTTSALKNAPSGGGGGDATLEKEEEILTAIAGVITHGDSKWLTGGGLSGSNTITINVHDSLGFNIVETAVEIWDNLGETFYERKNTNSSGQVVFNMDNGTYTVKIHKAGYSFEDTVLIVSAIASITYVMTAFVIPSPSDPTLCRVYTRLRLSDGTFPLTKPLSELKIVALPFKSDDSYYSENTLVKYNSANGIIYWDIIRGASVLVTIVDYGIRISFDVPDSDLWEF